MASYLIKNLPKTKYLRQPIFGGLHKRNTSQVSNLPKDVNPPQQGNSALTIAVGLSLGIGVTLLTQQNILDRFLPKEPIPDKPQQPASDPIYMQTILNYEGKLNRLENEVKALSNDLRQKDQVIDQLQLQPAASRRSETDVFELSKIIEANDLASASRHRRELEEQYKAINHEYMLKLEAELLKVENKYRPTINKIKELEAHLQERRKIQQTEAPARVLWICCQALLRRLQNSPREPLEKEPAYEMLKKFAANNNQLAMKLLDSIPAKVIKEGVYSEVSLMDRFNKIEKVCKRVAMVGDNGGGLYEYLISYIQSLFIRENAEVTDDEITGKKLVDPSSWQTYDILARVRYCLSNHNLEQAVRYANQLRGQARVVAMDWIRDARTHLETRQAFNVLSTYAEGVGVNALYEDTVN